MTNTTFYGPVDLQAPMSLPTHAVPKEYVDEALARKAPLDSPELTGEPKAPTPELDAKDGRIATTEFVHDVFESGLAGGSHRHYQSDIDNLEADLADKAPLDSPAFEGTPTSPTPATAANNEQIATTEFVKNQRYAQLVSPVFSGTPKAPTAPAGTNDTQLATTEFVATSYAPKDSPVLTGTPKAPTAPAGSNDDRIANTAFVQAAISSGAKAPMPTVNAGVGQWTRFVSITEDNTYYIRLPAGGTWAYLYGSSLVGVAAGGSTLTQVDVISYSPWPGNPPVINDPPPNTGFCWRIA